ncbi:acetyl esterase [Neorhizobium galegae]|uniref:alpha/beta hydrolase n=1 Tax=Neorhizobium galegae TaxID=399 RepID=UPI001AE43472|nr:alpha/beta hydrolase [Neorhizobium galegae]MBP2562506.1 acetyl esterase [Neorhizobium galegae]
MSLHPVVQAIWDNIKGKGFNGYSGVEVGAARAQFSQASQVFGPGPEMHEVREVSIPVDGDSIGARLYLPIATPVGLCVYFHGGGWTLGTLDDFDTLVRTLAIRSGAAFLSVDYRLAPEHPFPTPVDDAVAAIRFAAANGDALGGTGLLAVGGDSAGANLATVAALDVRGEIDIALQLLFNPVVDRDNARPGFATYGSDYLLKASDIEWFFDHYARGIDRAEPRLAPLRTPTLMGAPPAWIGVAEFDVLTEEAAAYASALEAAGTPVKLNRYAGVMHGFARQHGVVDVADRAVSEAAEALRSVFAA